MISKLFLLTMEYVPEVSIPMKAIMREYTYILFMVIFAFLWVASTFLLVLRIQQCINQKKRIGHLRTRIKTLLKQRDTKL